jgi:hypothetical protein
MEIKAEEIKIVPIDSIKPWSRNKNKHPSGQIERLIKVLEYSGFREPLVVDVDTNDVTVGCGRWMAAKQMGMLEVPVTFQKYDSEEQKYAHMVASNALASWAELDFAGINADLPDFGPELDVMMLGLKDFTVDVADREFDPSDKVESEKKNKVCPACGEIII